MAKLHNQNVPPSLTDGYNAVLDTTNTDSVAKVKAAVRKSPVPPEVALKTQIVTSASNWLCNRWLDHPDPATRSAFFNERAVEIREMTFTPTYWQQAALAEDKTEYATPVVSAYTGAVNPNYADDDHQPTTCTYSDLANVYATPEPPGTTDRPAPGWEGQTINKYWRDLWHAQRRLIFTLPFTMTKTDKRPIVIVCLFAITAQSTIRGNRNWYAVAIDKTFFMDVGGPTLKKAAITHFNRRRGYNFGLPPDDPSGWHNIVYRDFVEDARYRANKMPDANITRLMLRIATAPSLGFYGSRNDHVRVWHQETVRVYQAK